MYHRIHSLFILFVFHVVFNLSCDDLKAQDLNFFHYTVNEGLPSSQVHDIIQDEFGNLWFSTDQGLSRYDGYEFKNFTTSDGLTDNVIFKFYKQPDGSIWCTTYNKSIFIISGRLPFIRPYKFNKKLLSIHDNLITNCIYVSDDNSLYMSVVNGSGYFHIDSAGRIVHNSLHMCSDIPGTILLTDKKQTPFYFRKPLNTTINPSKCWTGNFFSGKKGANSGLIKAIYFGKQAKAIFSDYDSLIILDTEEKSKTNVPIHHEPISLGKFNDSLFWVGFRYGGVSIYDLKGKLIRSFLQSKSVTSLYIDHESGLWISTLNDGVYYVNNLEITSYSNNQLTDNWINSLKKDREGNLWIGHYNGNVSVLSQGRMILKFESKMKLPALLVENEVTGKIYFASDDKMFDAATVKPFNNITLNHVNVNAQSVDSFLISSYHSIVVLFKSGKKRIHTGFRVNDIINYQGEFYIASNKGLFKLKGQKLERYISGVFNSKGKVTDLNLWNNRLLLAAKGEGVIVYGKGKFFKIDKNSGLSNNIVGKLYSQNDSTFWVCTNNGLNRVVFNLNQKPRIDIITNLNGLISNEITDVEIIKDTVWVATREGLCCFPMTMLQKARNKLNNYLHLSYLKVNDSPFSYNKRLDLKYNESRVEFGFKAVSFLRNRPIQYRYKLIGLEDNWNYTEKLSVIYPSLPPGSYTFNVQANVNIGFWGVNNQQFSFIIAPPYWKTWWFRVLVIVLWFTLFYLFFKFRILSYNRDIIRELLRQMLKRVSRKTNFVVIREQGKDIRINSESIYFVKSDGNYIEIHTDVKKYVVRYKIGDFLNLVPDPLEYLRINRSCIIRIDKVQEKSKRTVTVKGEIISVGETYLEQLQKIKF